MADDFQIKFQTTADTAGAEAAAAATAKVTKVVGDFGTVTKATTQATTGASAPLNQQASIMQALGGATNATKGAMSAFSMVQGGDFVNALNQSKIALLGLFTVMRANPVGIAVTVVTALAAAYFKLTGDAEKAGTALGQAGTDAADGTAKMKAALDQSSAAMAVFSASTEKAKQELEAMRKAKDELADSLTAEKIAGIDEAQATGAMTDTEAAKARAKVRGDAERAKIDEQLAGNAAEREINSTAFQKLQAQKRAIELAEKENKRAAEAEQDAEGFASRNGQRSTRLDFVAQQRREQANRAATGLMTPDAIAEAEKKNQQEGEALNRQADALAAKRRTAGLTENKETAVADVAVTKEARDEALRKTREENSARERQGQSNEKDYEIAGRMVEKERKVEAERQRDEMEKRRIKTETRDAVDEGKGLLKGSARPGSAKLLSALEARNDGTTEAEAAKFEQALENFAGGLEGRDSKIVGAFQRIAQRLKTLESQAKNSRSFDTDPE